MRFQIALLGAATLAVARPALGVVLLNTEQRNTAAPTGELAGAGWQYEGQFAGFLGTAVGPNHFLTAQHIGGGVGQTFTYGGATFTTTAFTNVPGTDLRVWQVGGTLPTYAPLYNAAVDGSEVGKPMFVVGRGTQRGTPIYSADRPVDRAYQGTVAGGGEITTFSPTPVSDRLYGVMPPTVTADVPDATFKPSRLIGWNWGPGDRVQSWGTNVVGGVLNGGPTLGRVLAFDFSTAGGEDAASLTAGDSGGGVFIEADGEWKLAGINYGVDGPFRRSAAGGDFFASVFDARGLYFAASPPIYLDAAAPIAASSYASSVSANFAFIDGVLGPAAASVPEPASLSLLLAGPLLLLRRRR